ncbi:metallothionein family 11-domain-containing protein [Yarrowia lipolytica]|uniref:Metallothionein family 11-domain-containing protein n=1 Tax=Yarrowia lipolytica TaxID=4952 RepID=A0A371C785_YARLL|nr:metallothionein family 11-domain-containing protein [Yarrowia lipolytica]KAE8170765.1 metallothionein family 11-domain-containing protein [Yarrowia lipolytica]RDW25860.1 metallothionein family 11-domain-containing protein [Yarrowia lipolytica]RDW31637.1 metallothionein family 11-domain-containing protein [Yarrowia lipolytica]RMI94051.1 metallothionein family 11-domain-containing protein [Yarrowia lipolytica]
MEFTTAMLGASLISTTSTQSKHNLVNNCCCSSSTSESSMPASCACTKSVALSAWGKERTLGSNGARRTICIIPGFFWQQIAAV